MVWPPMAFRPILQAVTAQMVENFRSGGAAVNQLCRAFGVALTVHAFDLDKPTADVLQAPAMSEADCARRWPPVPR